MSAQSNAHETSVPTNTNFADGHDDDADDISPGDGNGGTAPSLVTTPSLSSPQLNAAAIALGEEEELHRKQQERAEREAIHTAIVNEISEITTKPSEPMVHHNTDPTGSDEMSVNSSTELSVSDTRWNAPTLVLGEQDTLQEKRAERQRQRAARQAEEEEEEQNQQQQRRRRKEEEEAEDQQKKEKDKEKDKKNHHHQQQQQQQQQNEQEEQQQNEEQEEEQDLSDNRQVSSEDVVLRESTDHVQDDTNTDDREEWDDPALVEPESAVLSSSSALSIPEFLPSHAIIQPGAMRFRRPGESVVHLTGQQPTDAGADNLDDETRNTQDDSESIVAANRVDESHLEAAFRARMLADVVSAEQVELVSGESGDGLETKRAIRRRRNRMITVVVVLVVVAIVIGIVVGVVLPSRSEDVTPGTTVAPVVVSTPAPTPFPTTSFPSVTPSFDPTSIPSMAPTRLTVDFLIGLVQSRVPSLSFDDVTSPEWQALDWMMNNSADNEALSDDGLVHRFGMGCVGFSFSSPPGWLTSDHECLWGVGQVRCGIDNMVVRLELSWNDLSGSIPVALGLLSTAVWLDVSDNELMGSIPSELGLLTKVTVLSAFYNSLTGTISSELGLLTALNSMLFTSNSLHGTIPTELGHLTKLEELYVGRNSFIGTIPTEFGRMTRMNQLYLEINNLWGTIPTELGKMTEMQYMHLFINQLMGTIPKHLGRMTNLVELWLGYNNLTGTMPFNLCSIEIPPVITCGQIECSCCTDADFNPC